MLLTGNIAQGRGHLDEAIALYDPAAHRPLATRFGSEPGVVSLGFKVKALWLLGYPEAALADADHALKDAREIGQAAALMLALFHASLTHIRCGNYTAATAEADELVALADKKTALFWKAKLQRAMRTKHQLPAGLVDLCDRAWSFSRSAGLC